MSKFLIIFHFPALLPVFDSENETLICKIAKPSEHSCIAYSPASHRFLYPFRAKTASTSSLFVPQRNPVPWSFPFFTVPPIRRRAQISTHHS